MTPEMYVNFGSFPKVFCKAILEMFSFVIGSGKGVGLGGEVGVIVGKTVGVGKKVGDGWGVFVSVGINVGFATVSSLILFVGIISGSSLVDDEHDINGISTAMKMNDFIFTRLAYFWGILKLIATC